jgi:hypothetical protein
MMHILDSSFDDDILDSPEIVSHRCIMLYAKLTDIK